MTRRTISLSAAAVGSAALLALAGCGSSGSTTTTPSASAQPGAQQQGRPAGGPFSPANVSALAKELGVTTTRLQQALAASRPAGAPNGGPPGGQQGSGQPPAGGGAGGGGFRGQMAANLAKQLNLSTDKVQQALAKVMPQRGQGTAPQAPSTTTATS